MRRLFVVCAVLAMLAGCKRAPSPTIKIDPALAVLVPADTLVLAGLRIEQLKQTEVYKRYQDRIDARLNEFAGRFGLDLERDLWEVIGVWDGKEAMLLARGKFSATGLEPTITKQGFSRSTYKGYLLIGNETHAVTFMNSTTAIAGPTPMVKASIDTRSIKKGGNAPALLDAAQQISSGNQAYVVGFGRTRLPLPKRAFIENINRLIESVERFQGAVDLRDGVKGSGEGLCTTEVAAEQLDSTLRGLLGVARLNIPDNRRDLLRLIDGINVSHEQRVFKVNAQISLELLDELAKLWGNGYRPSLPLR